MPSHIFKIALGLSVVGMLLSTFAAAVCFSQGGLLLGVVNLFFVGMNVYNIVRLRA